MPDGARPWLERGPVAVTYRPVGALKGYPKNARTHPPAQIEQIAAAIRAFGFTNPLLIDENDGIIAGHGRVDAARKLGMAEVPCIVLTGLTETQKRALVIADNKIALNAGWDNDLLLGELGELREEGFDLALTGFDDAELTRILGSTPSGGGLTDPDDAPMTPAHPVSCQGDLWLLGQHRLLCGDSTNPANVGRLMNGAEADMCFTSPPYAQQRDYKSGGISDWDALMQGVFGILPVKQDAQVLVNLGLVHRDNEWVPYWEGWLNWMRTAGWRRFGWYVWDQGPGLPGDWNGRLAPAHEFIWHFNRAAVRPNKTKAAKHAGQTLGGGGLRGADGSIKRKTGAGDAIQDRKIPDSVVRVMRHKGGLGEAGSHPAVFPVALAAEMMTAFSNPGEIVYEPFTGSGSQIIAAQMNDRACYGIELAPEYCDVAVRRWQLFTGQYAHLEDGTPFDQASRERNVA